MFSLLLILLALASVSLRGHVRPQQREARNAAQVATLDNLHKNENGQIFASSLTFSSILDNTENEEFLWACFCLLPRHVLPVLIELDIIMNESVTRRLFMFTLSNICLINGFQHSRSAKHCKICIFAEIQEVIKSGIICNRPRYQSRRQ